YLGKESNRFEEVEQNLVHDSEEVQKPYVDPNDEPWRVHVIPILKRLPGAEVARIAGITKRHVRRLQNGHQSPSPRTRALLTRAAADHARTHLAPTAAPDDLAACAAFLHQLNRQNHDASATGPGATTDNGTRAPLGNTAAPRPGEEAGP